MDPIFNLVIGAINKFVTGILQDAVDTFVGVVGREMQIAMAILDNPLIQNGILLAQAIAGSLLALKLAVEITRTYILYQGGDSEADPGGLLIRSGMAAATIGATPWIVRTVYTWGNDVAMAIGEMPSVTQTSGFFDSLLGLASMSFIVCITAIIALVIWLLILLQVAIRGVELGLLAVAGPVMAVGLTSVNEGVWATWWRELLVLSLTQCFQMLTIKGFLTQVVSISTDMTALLMAIAWLWVALKTPNFLRQFAHHTGVGRVMGSAAQTGGSMLLMRKIITRGR